VDEELWRSNEPNGHEAGEHAIDLLYIPSEWGLNDEQANKLTGYICEQGDYIDFFSS